MYIYSWMFVFVLAQTAAMAWLLKDRQSIGPSVALGTLLVAIWLFEIVSLYTTATGLQVIEPRLVVGKTMLVYAVFWGTQVFGAGLFYAFMRMHTLPAAFEFLGCHVLVSAVIYFLEYTVRGLRLKSRAIEVVGRPWWNLPASYAGISPSCGLLSLLVCKACGLF